MRGLGHLLRAIKRWADEEISRMRAALN